MVIIGGMRSLLGPALGALFYILFREYLSIWTPNWLLFFGLLFVGFIVFSPTGLVGVWRRVTAPMRAKRGRGGGDGGAHDRAGDADAGIPVPRAQGCGHAVHSAGARQEVRRHPRGRGGEHRGGGSFVARADRSERRGQDDRLQSDLRPVRARPRTRRPRRAGPHRTASASDRRGGARALVPDHEPVPVALDRGEPAARRAGARCQSFRRLEARRIDSVRGRQDLGAHPFPGTDRHRTRGGRGIVVRRAAAARHGTGAGVGAAAPAARRAARRDSPRRSASA